MKKLFLSTLAALLFGTAYADTIKTVAANSTDRTVTVRIIDSTDGTPETGVAFNTSGIDLEYWRHGANAAVDITEATQTVNGAHADGGFVHIGHGVYRLDLPDAAVASGADAVDVYGTVTGMIVIGGTVEISPPVNVVSTGTDAITATSIAADAIGASEIATDAIGAAELAANSITASEIADDSIDAGAIAASAIGASEVATDAIGAAELAADAVTEVQSGLATAAALAVVDDFVDTEVAAILDDTGTSGVVIVNDGITAAKIAADAIGASEIAADAIASSELAATAVSEIADQVWLETIATHSGSAGSTAEALAAAGGGGATDQELGIAHQGTAQGATATTIQLASAASFADDTTIGMTVLACGSTQGYCQSRAITDYVGSTDTATVETWTVTPSGTITAYVFGTAPGAASGGGLDAAGVRAALGMASASYDTDVAGLNTKLDTIDNFVDTEVAAILDDTGTSGVQIPNGEIVAATFGAGAIDAAAIATDAIGAAELAADAIGASEIAANALTTAEIATGAISADEVADDAIDAGAIAAAAIGASEIATDALGAAELAADAVTEAQSGLATAAALTVVDDFLDTEIAAIKAKTDSLNFTVSGQVDANTQYQNDAQVCGVGTSVDKWRACP